MVKGLVSKGVEYIKQKYGVTPPDFSEGNFDGLYSIYDVCQKQFLPPYPSPSVDACKRDLRIVVEQNPSSLMSKFPSDYILYRLAYWDNKTGYISYDVPEQICNLFTILAVSNKQSEVKNGDEVQHKV